MNATADLSALAGLQVVLTFANHDDNYSGDATFSRFDDVTLAAGSGGGGGGGAAGVSNGDFEAGTLSGWTAAGAASVSSASHGGAHAALVGKISASTDSSIRQTVTVPATGATLSFWYQPNCPDTVQYDWATVQVQSVSGAVLLTALPRTCSNSGVWTPVTVDLSAYANNQSGR